MKIITTKTLGVFDLCEKALIKLPLIMLHGYIYLLYPAQPVAEGTGMFLTRPSGLVSSTPLNLFNRICETLLL